MPPNATQVVYSNVAMTKLSTSEVHDDRVITRLRFGIIDNPSSTTVVPASNYECLLTFTN